MRLSVSDYVSGLLGPRRRRVVVGALIAAIYLCLAFGSAETKRPWEDEAFYADPAFNLINNGFMGVTIFEFRGLVDPPPKLGRIYSQPPLHFVMTSVWFKVLGFGVVQLRMAAMLWGLLALMSWYVILRRLCCPPGAALLVVAFISFDYFFLLSASDGRMDMMCLSLGVGGLAAYLNYREKAFSRALFVSNALVVMSGLTHPTGIVYFCGLAFLVLYYDRRRLNLKNLGIAALPYCIGALGWGSYIMLDPGSFRAQFLGNMALSAKASGVQAGTLPWLFSAVHNEIERRYLQPFGFSPGVALANRLKALTLISYLAGAAGILLVPKLRRDRGLLLLISLLVIAFTVMTFATPSKNYYYLPHTTMILAACLAVFVMRAFPASRTGLTASALILTALSGLQVAGVAYRIRQDPYKKSYLPVIQQIKNDSAPGSLIMGVTGLWFHLAPDRTLLQDSTFGCLSGLKPDLIVMDPLFVAYQQETRRDLPKCYTYAQDVLGHSRLLYDDGYYQIYRPGT